MAMRLETVQKMMGARMAFIQAAEAFQNAMEHEMTARGANHALLCFDLSGGSLEIDCFYDKVEDNTTKQA